MCLNYTTNVAHALKKDTTIYRVLLRYNTNGKILFESPIQNMEITSETMYACEGTLFSQFKDEYPCGFHCYTTSGAARLQAGFYNSWAEFNHNITDYVVVKATIPKGTQVTLGEDTCGPAIVTPVIEHHLDRIMEIV